MSAEKLSQSLAILGGEGLVPDIIASRYPQALHVRIGEEGQKIGQIGDVIVRLKQAGIEHLCLIGRMKRPNFMSLLPSAETTKLIMKHGFSLKGGDDALLKRLRVMLEDEGFQVVGAHRLCPDLLMPQGLLTETAPNEDMDPAAYIDMAREFGLTDKGQSIILSQGVQIDSEDKEGTNALIKRNAGRQAVLVKASKPQQDLDLDMPAIGPHTIDHLIKAGFMGMVLEAGKTLFVEREACIAKANAHNLFIIGV